MRTALSHFWLLPILFSAAALRFFGLKWDDGFHLHPDERHITMVASKITLPNSLASYFDTARSPLNPYNNGVDGFAYGTLPLFLGRWIGELTGMAGYDPILVLGRALSALSDLGTVVFVYLLANLVYGRRAAIAAAAITAFSVTHIQLSHFYAFDTFTTFFAAWALYFAYRLWMRGGWVNAVLLGCGVGFATASKISAITLLPIAGLACLVPWPGRRFDLGRVVKAGAIVGLATLFSYRVVEPYAFLGTHPFDFRPNPKFVADMLNWIRISSGEVEVPYMLQWANTPKYLFVLDSLVRWGLGPAAGLASLVGLALAAYRTRRWGWHGRHLLLVAWGLLNLVYFGGQFAKFMRYLLPAYPALAILGGWLLGACWDAAGRWWRHPDSGARLAARLAAAAPVVVLATTIAWALAFVQIYNVPNTRVEASRWMLDNLPNGATIGAEHWDDELPLSLPGKERKGFRHVSMTLYDDERPEKLRKLLESIERADYIVLSSNRLYGSIPRLPQRFPLGTEYYQALFDGRLGYELIAEFTSRPSILGLQIVDDNAQEDFTVYDHPKVSIYARGAGYDRAQVAALLGSVPLDNVQRGRAADGGGVRAPILTPSEWQAARAGGTWSALFDPDGLANRLALVVWWLAAALCGLAAWPLLWRLTPHLADGGFGLARTLGILLVAHGAWLLASLKLLPFGRGSLFLMLALVAAGSAWACRGRVARFRAYARSAWPSLVGGELAFTVGFGLCLMMRLVNPDLWHGSFGGEKPMDFAYLNAVVKSDYFPPYDPWFSGGLINYYYFGFVLVAAVIKLSGVIPSTAYNLALALWFGLLCQAAFSLAHNLVLERRAPGRPRARLALVAGALAAMLVALVGNLDGAIQVRDALWKAGGSGFQSAIPVLAGLVRTLSGLVAVLGGGGRLEFDFWRSTRLIGPEDPGPITEFPFFTFLYGDLHAHMLALPLTLLAIGLSLELARSTALRGLMSGPLGGQWPPRGELARFGAVLVLAGLTVGALRATNTWDYPTYLAAVLLGLACLFRPLDSRRVLVGPLLAAGCGAVVFLSGALLFAPYVERYQLFYSGVDPSKAQTPVWQFLTINGVWVFALASYLVFEIARRTAAAATRASGPRVNSRLPRPMPSYYSLALPAALEWPLESNWRATGAMVALLALALAAAGWTTLALTFVLGSALVGLVVLRWRSRETVFAAGLALLALGVLSVPEVVAIKGDIGRMNTVFKFYFQAWVLLGVLSAVWLARLVARSRAGWPYPVPWRRFWLAALAVLMVAVLIYPLRGAPGRLLARFTTLPLTLDGMDFMQKAQYRDRERDVQMAADHAALRWMQDTLPGSPVVLEANTGLYKWGSRVSIYTGLPTVIGWDWHQKQQRVAGAGAVEERLRDVKTIYEAGRLDQVLPLLRKYDVEYIYVGGLERIYYPEAGLRKLEQAPPELLEPIYQRDGVTIYRLKGIP